MTDPTEIVGWRYDGADYCPPCLVEALVIWQLAGPAALDMDPAEVVSQVAEANAFSPSERPYPIAATETDSPRSCDTCLVLIVDSPQDSLTQAISAPRCRHVTIWLNTNPRAFLVGFEDVDELRPVYSYVIEPPASNVDELEEIAEQAFRMFNDMPTTDWEHHHTERYYAAVNRSLSVGDVVVIDHTALACEAAGYTRVPLPTEPR